MIIQKIKNLAKKYLPSKLKDKIICIINNRLHQISYSQFGEDLVLKSYFPDFKNTKGFYVDIGAFHPSMYSNTKLFYKNGWNGINIDAKPGSMKRFNKKRKRDINIEAAINNESIELDFFIFKESPLNTLSKNLAQYWIKTKGTLIKIIKIKTIPLSIILEKNINIDQKIDFMNIDCEGFDINVLKSNNWSKYLPKFILIEDHDFDLNNIEINETYLYLKEQGYKLESKTNITLLFKYINI